MTEDSSLPLTVTVSLIIAGFVGAALLVYLIFLTEPEAERGERPEPDPVLVETTTADTGTFRPLIEAMGTVRPTREVNLNPRLSGHVLERSDDFDPGSTVEAGEELLQLDPANFRQTLRQRRSEVQQAESDLKQEMGRQEVARQEYKLLGDTIPEENRDLVLRKPQLQSARASLESARAALEQAQLDLERTTIEAPFDGLILTREVDAGAEVSPGQNLGRLVGTDRYWVEATLPTNKLRHVQVDPGNPTEGSPVQVRNRTAWAEGQSREGYVERLIGELDESSRMARLLIVVPDPVQQDPALTLGSYVENQIKGEPIENVTRLPRNLLRDDDTVWIMDDEELDIRSVEVVMQDSQYSYVRGNISNDDQVVTSSLSAAIDGMPLAPADEETSNES